MQEGFASWLSADSDLSWLEIKKLLVRMEITGGENLLLTVDELNFY